MITLLVIFVIGGFFSCAGCSLLNPTIGNGIGLSSIVSVTVFGRPLYYFLGSLAVIFLGGAIIYVFWETDVQPWSPDTDNTEIDSGD
jgi:hypothetical protein